MAISSATNLTFIIFIFSFGAEKLSFSFRSQYDGYIYPKWKKKDNVSVKFYEDAVVVGQDFIVLGDGVGGAKGLSGVFSIHQCLNIADKLKKFVPTSVDDLTDAVSRASDKAVRELGLPSIYGQMRNVATTLVYIKLQGNKMYSGVVGDSGFSIYRYYKDEGILKLEKRSQERVVDYNTPCSVTPEGVEKPWKDTHEVKKGDVVVVASDGVLDVLPSSFITAATNFLVGKMIEKKRDNKSLDDFDYDYDLADFVEGYVQNLSELSIKLKNFIFERQTFLLKKAIEQAQNLSKELLLLAMTPWFKEQFKVTKPSTDQLGVKILDPDDFDGEDPEKDSSENPDHVKKDKEVNDIKKNSSEQNNLHGKIDDMMKNIYKYEICNIFDPYEDNRSFKTLKKYDDFKNLTHHNLKHKDQFNYKHLNCFKNKIIEKTTPHHSSPTKWACKNVLDLTYPIHPPEDPNQKQHDFKQCVIEAIPKLPKDTKPEEIAEAFNSRYFARNIALAVKYVTEDPRVKVDDFILKKFFDKEKHEVVFSYEKLISFRRKNWVAKDDDVSIAAAAITSEDKFDKVKLGSNASNILRLSLKNHSSAMRYLFKILTAQDTSGRII